MSGLRTCRCKWYREFDIEVQAPSGIFQRPTRDLVSEASSPSSSSSIALKAWETRSSLPRNIRKPPRQTTPDAGRWYLDKPSAAQQCSVAVIRNGKRLESFPFRPESDMRGKGSNHKKQKQYHLGATLNGGYDGAVHNSMLDFIRQPVVALRASVLRRFNRNLLPSSSIPTPVRYLLTGWIIYCFFHIAIPFKRSMMSLKRKRWVFLQIESFLLRVFDSFRSTLCHFC